jgi:hypothetical protein
MKAQVSFDELGHEAIEGAAAGGDELEDVLALAFAFEGAFDRFDLTLNAADAGQGSFLVFGGVGQGVLREPFVTNNILPYTIGTSEERRCWKRSGG